MSTRPRLLITRKVFPEVLARLAPHFEIDSNQEDEDWPRATLLGRAADRDALFVTAIDRVDRELLEACPRVRIVATGSVGYNHVDLAACAERGVAVTNTPDVLTEATADLAWTLLMATARRVCESEHWLRAGKWGRWSFDQWLGADVYGTTLGIVGMGRIGSAVARRARGFAMKILYHNRSRAANEAELGARRVELDELLREADHVILVLPYSAATHHVIGARELAAMKPGATLVNVARGGIVDDAALVEALRAGRLGGAGLDVYENEPALNPGLLTVPNVVLTPHIGSATRSSRLGMAMLAADNLVAFATGGALLTPVSAG
ncbi:MAG: D-glycerate dehydrogenase [Lautropia sp.]|nr:MAG: D-glycerate dehydrogenase [Pseudomonadota bacterium]MBC6960931.1 D-glycerate dehydrogenase [Lautropia sp.]MCL4702521.1 D-glycerate dehydrogenase [Burkholderiaceae bacterium]MDL1907664.1 D-glycerate dehydrogenase [Betaproteobacteria bacterium PRO1]MEB2335850.1 D-glycerate dehydrogenase [Burkholderiales bacterium]